MGLTDEIAQLRTDAQQFMTDTCDILRKTTASDNAGGITVVRVLIGDDVPCIVSTQTVSPTSEQEGARVESITQWMLTLPALQDIDIKDEVLYQGRTYEVGAVSAPKTNEVVRRVALNLVI